MKTDFPRWIAWSAAGAMAGMALMVFPGHLPTLLVAVVVVLSHPLYLLSATASLWIVFVFAYCLILSAILLLPLLFREKRWKVAAGLASFILLAAVIIWAIYDIGRWGR